MTEPGSLAALRRRGGSMLSSLSSSLESWCRRFLDLLELKPEEPLESDLPESSGSGLTPSLQEGPSWSRSDLRSLFFFFFLFFLPCKRSSRAFTASFFPLSFLSLRRLLACWFVCTPHALSQQTRGGIGSSLQHLHQVLLPGVSCTRQWRQCQRGGLVRRQRGPSHQPGGRRPSNPRVAPASRSKGGGRPYDSLPGLPELVAQSCAVGTSSICLAIQLFAIRGDTRSPAAAGSFRLEGTLAGALERLGAAAARRPSEGGLTALDGLLEGSLPTPTQVVGRELLECPGPHASGMNPYSSIEGQWTGILGAQMHSPSHHAIECLL